MDTTTWLFFIFNCLIALWIIGYPILLEGKLAKLSQRVTLVVTGVAYGAIVITAMIQVLTTDAAVSSYL